MHTTDDDTHALSSKIDNKATYLFAEFKINMQQIVTHTQIGKLF